MKQQQIGRHVSGETDAALFRSLYPQLRRVAAVSSLPEVDPDDLVQEALVRTLRRHRLADLDHPAAYLSRTILNLASNHRRKLGRARRALARLGTHETTEVSYPSDLSELMRLTPEQRFLLYLCEVEGRTYREAAELAAMTEAAVAKAVQRARGRLRTELTAFEETP